jgi:hypothetical protein
MIDVQGPKAKLLPILSGQTMSKTRGRANFQVIEHNHGTDRRVAECKEKGVLAFGWVGRTIHENEAGLFQAPENIGVTREIEGFDQSQSIPAAPERDHRRFVGRAVRGGCIGGFGLLQPIGGMFEAKDCREGAAEHGRRATGTKLKRMAVGREKLRDIFQKLAA